MQSIKIEDMGNLQGEWSEENTHKEKQSWPKNISIPQESTTYVNV